MATAVTTAPKNWAHAVLEDEVVFAAAAVAAGLVVAAAIRVATRRRAEPQPEGVDMARSVPASVGGEYVRRYEALRVRPERVASVDEQIGRILQGRPRYEAMQRDTGVPWYVVAAIHLLESSLRFNAHLHNGNPLTGRTTDVPSGRPEAPPASGSFPYTWEESARDALGRFAGWRDWSVAGTLYQLERYNGWGYQRRGVPSPYLYSFSDQYTKGKYASDGNYDPELVSRQVGAATLLKRMEERGLISLPR